MARVQEYNPDVAPNAEQWLDTEAFDRLMVLERYHRDARIDLPKSARRLHATFHVIVENQLAMNDEPVVRA